MLLQFRNLTRGAIATIILALVGVAMVAFLIPNGGLQLAPSQNVAEVGGRAISTADFGQEFEQTLRRARAQGATFTQAEAIEQGLHREVLERVIGREAVFAYTQKMSVSVSDLIVGEEIRNTPAFRSGLAGGFDRQAYAEILRREGFSEETFERRTRDSMSATMLMQALTVGVRAPSSFGALALTYEAETRTVSIAEAPASVAGAIPNPNQAQLQTLWEESQEQLRVPEFRALTLVYARPQDFAARINVPETRLREEFDARRAALTQPERRTYVRVSAQNEAQANDAATRLARGESADAVAAALGLQATRGENQARRDVPDRGVGEAVFAMQPGSARAVRGQLTPWAAVRLESVSAAVEPNFAALRDELRNAIAADEAADLLNAAIGAFEEARAAGATVVDAARQAGLPAVTIPSVEAGGRAQDGTEVEALAGNEQVLATAFETPEGEASDFMPVEDADVVVSVDRIIPSTVRPLNEVRADLTQLFIARERARRLREVGEEMVAAVEGGQTLAAAARAHRFNVVVSSRPITRQESSQIPARGLAGQIFAAHEGDAVSDMRADGGAVLVAVVEAITRPDPAAQPQVVEANRAQLEQVVGASLGEALQAEIIDRAAPRRNERLLEQAYRSAASADGEDTQ